MIAAYITSIMNVPMLAGRNPLSATPAAYVASTCRYGTGRRGYAARRIANQPSAVSVVCSVCSTQPAKR